MGEEYIFLVIIRDPINSTKCWYNHFMRCLSKINFHQLRKRCSYSRKIQCDCISVLGLYTKFWDCNVGLAVSVLRGGWQMGKKKYFVVNEGDGIAMKLRGSLELGFWWVSRNAGRSWISLFHWVRDETRYSG